MKKRMTLLGRAARGLAVWMFVSLPAWAAPQIDVFSPQGEAKGVRQVGVEGGGADRADALRAEQLLRQRGRDREAQSVAPECSAGRITT